MEKLANKLSNITKSAQTGSQVKSNWALPTNQYVQMAYNDPKFALGNLIGTYLLNRYVGNVDNGEANDMQPKLTTDSGALLDYQSTLNADTGHRFQVDENGNVAYHAPTLAPAITVDNPIQANQDFKDYYNSYNNKNVDGSGLLDMTQLAQMAGVSPTAQTQAATQTPAVTAAPQAGAVNPSPLNGGNFAIDGDLGKYATTNPQSLTGGTWKYHGQFPPKNYGDIAWAAVSPTNTDAQTKNEPMYTLNGDFPGMIRTGNIDIANRPTVKLPDGRTATVFSKSFNLDGKEVLLPTVSKDGKLWTDQEAVDNYRKTGENLGVFDSPEAASRYAQALHEQQDEMYVRPNEQPIKDNTPIKDERQPIKEEPQPITANTAPITEDKKEQLNGNTLRIQSANDGNMYDFTISSDGKWIHFPNGGKMPATQKDALITAMHNPKQSYYDIEISATPLHNHMLELPQDIKEAIKKDPNKAVMARLMANNVDLRDLADSTNPGVFTDNLHIGIPNTAQSTTQTPVNPNEVQPFNAEQWKRDFIIRQRKKGFSGDVINDMLGDLMPQAQAQEDKYNRYQAGILTPLYQAAIKNKDYSTAAQLAQGMMQYNKELGNYMFSTLPTAQNFYATDVKNEMAKTANDYKMGQIDKNHAYKVEDDNKAHERQKELKQIDFNNQVYLKQLDERLRELNIHFTNEEKRQYAALGMQDKYNYGIAHGLTPEQSLGLAGFKGTTSKGGGSEKVPKDVQKAYNNVMNKFNAGLSAVKSDPNSDEAANAVEDLTKYVQDNKDNFDPSMASTMYAMGAMLEGFRYKMQGNNDDAAQAWGQVPSHLLKQYLGNDNSDLNFDEYPDW